LLKERLLPNYRLSLSLKVIHQMFKVLFEALYGLVLSFFKSTNRRVKSRLTVWYMRKETSEHFHLMAKMFKWAVFPASLLYVCMNLFFFGKTSLDSVVWGISIFFYSNFLPDMPAVFRKKRNEIGTTDLAWYKKYALLLFAPIIIWLLFSGIQLEWKTTENFHNFRSLVIYGAFLLALSFFLFGELPISIGDITKIISLSVYGMTGYFTHLKVDKIL
jgi:hypothetical protein